MSMQKVQSAPEASSRVSHPAECNREDLHQVSKSYAKSIQMRFVLRDATCDQKWAVLVGELEDPHAPIDGPQGVGTTLTFYREGNEWKHQDASSVCGTLNPEKPEARPQDAKIPALLYFLGCLVG